MMPRCPIIEIYFLFTQLQRHLQSPDRAEAIGLLDQGGLKKETADWVEQLCARYSLPDRQPQPHGTDKKRSKRPGSNFALKHLKTLCSFIRMNHQMYNLSLEGSLLLYLHSHPAICSGQEAMGQGDNMGQLVVKLTNQTPDDSWNSVTQRRGLQFPDQKIQKPGTHKSLVWKSTKHVSFGAVPNPIVWDCLPIRILDQPIGGRKICGNPKII